MIVSNINKKFYFEEIDFNNREEIHQIQIAYVPNILIKKFMCGKIRIYKFALFLFHQI